MLPIRYFFLTLALWTGAISYAQEPVVILKLDDLWFEHDLVHPGWIEVIDYLRAEQVTGTIGLVCESLLEGNEAYFDWIKAREREGYEIWHHGLCHCKPTVAAAERREFRGTPADYQQHNLQHAHDLAKEKLALTFRTFGAPYNSTDSSTVLALAAIPDIKVWLYKETDVPTDKFLLSRIPAVNIEYPVHVPDFAQFKQGFEAYRNEPVLVIQGHPRSWVEDPTRFEEFKAIIQYLKAEGASFTTPYQYYLDQQAHKG
jgi:peptidoglycan/xylan/chitin deacetylase (PgdA/CDA1 family)